MASNSLGPPTIPESSKTPYAIPETGDGVGAGAGVAWFVGNGTKIGVGLGVADGRDPTVGAGVGIEVACGVADGRGVGPGLGGDVASGFPLVAAGALGACVGARVGARVGADVDDPVGGGVVSCVGRGVARIIGVGATSTMGTVVGIGEAAVGSVRTTSASMATIAWPFVPATTTVSTRALAVAKVAVNSTRVE
jgi:hypothetical protein